MERKTSFLSILLVLLFALVIWRLFGSSFFFGKSSYQKSITLTKETVNTLEIQEGNTTLVMTKDNNRWNVEGKQGEKSKIENLLSLLLTGTNAQQVAKTNANDSAFEMTTEKATVVRLEGTEVFSLGKTTPFGTYVRIGDDTSVYLLPDLTAGKLATQSSFWIDLTVFSANDADIQHMELATSTQTTTLMQANNVWKEEKTGKEIKRETISSLLLTLSSLEADAFATEDEKKTVSTLSSLLTLTIETTSGKETLAFKKRATDIFIERSDGEVFKTVESRISPILLAPKTIAEAK